MENHQAVNLIVKINGLSHQLTGMMKDR